MLFSSVVKLFEGGNVCVTGLRGTGKDILFGNVIARRKSPYISNLDYTDRENFMFLNFDNLNLNKNNYDNLISNNVNKYDFNNFYLKGQDIYLSDAGVYFPSQYCGELNHKFKHFPMYMALSRQVSSNNFHINCQNLNRVWDKIREQSDIYIRCRYCKVFKIPFINKELVFMKITLYDKYESCVDRVEPCSVSVPLLNKERRQNALLYLDNFKNTHGVIKNKYLLFFNKSKHDTFYFDKLFRGGVVEK